MGLVSDPRKRATLHLALAAVANDVKGDFVETGVYLGGSSTLLMRVLKDFDTCDRHFWAFDSFVGLPGARGSVCMHRLSSRCGSFTARHT